MIEVRPFANLGRFENDWLQARYHFSFAGYHDPSRRGVGPLLVWNDDRIQPGTGACRRLDPLTSVLGHGHGMDRRGIGHEDRAKLRIMGEAAGRKHHAFARTNTNGPGIGGDDRTGDTSRLDNQLIEGRAINDRDIALLQAVK